jgi:hypothetical protein
MKKALFVLSANFVFLNFLLFGCASSQKTAPSRGEKAIIKNFELMDEEFDPLTLREDDIQIEDATSTSSAPEEVAENVEAAITDTLVTGYRIQIIQTSDSEEAKNVQRDAVLRFNEDVYRVFDPPFYKVRVGNFLNWYDAEKLQKLAIQRGYRDAWVVRTKVNLKKASRWIDDL